MISAAKFLLLAALIVLFQGCQKNPPPTAELYELKGEIFGSYYIIKYHGPLAPEDFATKLKSFFEDFNREFSTYQKDSVISNFNQMGANTPLTVSKRFIEMIELAQKIYLATQGAFDPTLGPVIKVWGFGGGKKNTPTEHEIRSALAKVGFGAIKWDKKKSTIQKTKSGLELDVNAFAPGLAADLIGEIFSSHGIENFMIDISGEILFKGSKPQGAFWIAGIERPHEEQGKAVFEAFKIKDLAIATSGSYRQFIVQDGKKKSHIIDPRSSNPVTHTIASATVLAPSAAIADAWSTALMVLGPQGIELAEKQGIKVFLLEAVENDKFNAVISPSMNRYLEANRP